MATVDVGLEAGDIVFRTFILRACSFAGAALFVYDYALTIGMEVDLVWWSEWNVVKVLYLIQRYMPFADAIALTIWYKSMAWMYIIGVAISEVVLTWRAWAVWNQDKRLTYALPIFFLALWAPNFWCMSHFLDNVILYSLPEQNLYCLFEPKNRSLAICYILLSAYEACILALMLLPGIQNGLIALDSGLIKAVFRDGALFFVYLLVLSMVNVVVIFILPLSFVNMLSWWVQALYLSFKLITCEHGPQSGTGGPFCHDESGGIAHTVSMPGR
ncbi:hypothetical protein AX16_001674 [Volvariella volvacea WC 439]|nr:hypothetical protein AX16_001674 [Volvariella volvacea WC 439]